MTHHGETLFGALLTLLFGGIGHTIKELHANGTLHYILAGTQWTMYACSITVALITITKYLKDKRNGHKQSI